MAAAMSVRDALDMVTSSFRGSEGAASSVVRRPRRSCGSRLGRRGPRRRGCAAILASGVRDFHPLRVVLLVGGPLLVAAGLDGLDRGGLPPLGGGGQRMEEVE